MTYIVSGGALNSAHSLSSEVKIVILSVNLTPHLKSNSETGPFIWFLSRFTAVYFRACVFLRVMLFNGGWIISCTICDQKYVILELFLFALFYKNLA